MVVHDGRLTMYGSPSMTSESLKSVAIGADIPLIVEFLNVEELMWEISGWWRVLAPDGSLWCEASDEKEVRASMRPGDTLQVLKKRDQRRKNRGRRSRKQFCWCGFEKTARRGHLRCLVHTTGQMAPAVVDQPEETLPIVEHTPENEPVVPPDLEAQPYRVDVVIKERRQDSTPRTIVEVVENEYVTVVSKVSGRKSQIAWKNLKRYDIV